METLDMWMVLLFPFLDFIPYGLPRYWLFRDRLRLPFGYIVLLMCALTAVNSAVFYWINLGGLASAAMWTTLMRYGFMLVNLALSFLLIREHFPKLMFTYLLMLAWSFFVCGNANYIESRFFWDFSEKHPYLVYNIARMVIYLLTAPFLFHFFKHTVARALKIDDPKMWRYFWIIPLFTALFGLLYCTTSNVYAYASWQFLFSRYFMLLGGCYASYVALKALEISQSRTQLQEALKYADRSIGAQKKQYNLLASHMGEMRKARHDLRQHLAVIQAYMEQEDRAGLVEYMSLYQSHLSPEAPEQYCHVPAVNAIISYYAAQARGEGVQFAAKVDYPDHFALSDTDITVLLGNLLENALEACRRETAASKRIELRVKRRENATLVILVDNSCLTPVAFEEGMPVSSKHDGWGIGTASIRCIAEQYGGIVKFEQTDGMFYASVLLHPAA